jgi:site-specific DNA-methyltransferase (adenine-specific)
MKPYYEQSGVTIYHGDCREVVRDIGLDWAFGVVISDPPYGREVNSGWDGRHGDLRVAGDCDTDSRDYAIAVAVDRNVPAAIFGSPQIQRPSNPRAILIWDKGEHVGMGDLSFPWKPNWEEIYIFGQGWHGDRSGSVLRHLAIAGCVGVRTWRHHPVEKPESLMRDLIYKAPAGMVLDPFMGSGTTLVAAKRLGRQAVGIEIEERYCEVAAKRLQQEALPLEMTS